MTHKSDLPYRPNVGIALFNQTGQIFLGRRADMRREIWQCPQGGIDEDESVRDAAMRELSEEIGTRAAVIVGEHPDWLSYDLPSHLIGVALGGAFRGQTQKWVAMRFTGQDHDIRLDRHLPVEFKDWRWVDLAEVFSYELGFKRPLYRKILPMLARMAQS
ncbi:MAG: RNA pyrophosphohydrolase [Acetobacteraceae bacterium]